MSSSGSGAAGNPVEQRIRTFLDAHLPPKNEGHPGARPWVTLTFAQSRDGKISGPGKKMLALSGDQSGLMTHHMRARHEGILVGIGTLLNDNPQLNARRVVPPPPVGALPRPVVLDSALRTPPACRLLELYRQGAGRQPLLVSTAPTDEGELGQWQQRQNALKDAGAEIALVSAPPSNARLSWEAVWPVLSDAGIRSLMIEGGATVIDSVLAAHAKEPCVDVIIVTVAPMQVGEAGYGYTTALPLDPNSEVATSAHVRERGRVHLSPDDVVALGPA